MPFIICTSSLLNELCPQKVAVRVRPFLQREIDSKSKLIVDVQGNTTTIIDPAGRSAPKSFSFDFAYWSFDGLSVNPDGTCVPQSERYADQHRVFADLGAGVVSNALLGYNSAVFAYGQTSSGTSYSMIGYGPNKGIIPLTMEALFAEVTTSTDAAKQFQVTFSMFEIYNEKVRDLLAPLERSPKEGLKIRQSPKHGFFVEVCRPSCMYLSSYPLFSYRA